jgi:V8-like Glu-specific endopeptidase
MMTRTLAVTLLAAILLTPLAVLAEDLDRTTVEKELARLRQSSLPTPMLLPDPNAPRSEGPGQLITRDLLTGETHIYDGTDSAPTTGLEVRPGGPGIMDLLLGNPVPPANKNFNAWTEVDDPTTGTYPRRVRMWSRYRDSTDTLRTFDGSGTLIDPYHVITAAHCIYKLPGGPRVYPNPWAESMTIVPAYEDGVAPLGTAGAAQLHSWSNYTESADWDHDIAVITLDRPLGALAGWAGYGYNTDYDYYTGGTWRHEGYPAEDPFDGENLFENAGTFDESPVDGWDYRLGFFAPSWGGSSGSGAVRDGVVFGVLSGSDRATHTEDVILTPTKFAHVGGWIAAVTPSGFDLIPLMVQTTANVAAGGNLGWLNFVLHNYGASWANGSRDYTIYLSADANITSSDIYLGAGSFDISLPGKQSQVIALPAPNIPSYVASGAWFVGIILDVADANQSNNDTSGQEAAPVAVDCAPAPPAPILTAPSNGAICRVRDNLSLSWSDLGSGDEYEIQLGPSPGIGTITTISNQNYLQVSGLAASTNYYWRVRGRLGCGTWGSWSGSRTFRTQPNPYVVSTLVAPVEETHCLPTSVSLQWTALPDAASYQVQISPNWCYEGPITTGIAGTQYTATGLDPNTTYYWRVRAETVCGTLTNWSSVPGFCWTFKTGPTSVPVPTVLGPADGATCAAFLIWSHAEDWDHYEVQVGESCGTGTIYTTTSNGLWPDGLTTGEVYVWRVRTVHECGLTSNWSTCRSFTLDDVPPTNPETPIASNTHQVEVWSTDNTINTWWDWGYDNCSGSFPQYATLWDNDPLTEPTIPTTNGEMTLETSPPLADGNDHWFHVRTIDWAGNMAVETMHLGPFWIDTTPPEAVSDLWLCEPVDLTGDFGTVTGNWGAAVDSTAGVAGYSLVVQPGPPVGAVPDGTIETAGLTATVSVASSGGWSFGVRAVDAAGNVGPVAALGQVMHNPSLPAFLAPQCGTELFEGQSYDVQWESVSYGSSGRLKLSTDEGATFTTFAELDQFDLVAGTWPWVVPWANSDRMLLQLEIDTPVARIPAASRYFTITAVSAVPDDLPLAGGTRLVGNYPNPFNPTTTIVYSLEQAQDVRLEIFDASGRRLRRLVSGLRIEPGRHEVVWDGRSDAGRQVASGVYYVRLVTEEGSQTKSMALLK